MGLARFDRRRSRVVRAAVAALDALLEKRTLRAALALIPSVALALTVAKRIASPSNSALAASMIVGFFVPVIASSGWLRWLLERARARLVRDDEVLVGADGVAWWRAGARRFARWDEIGGISLHSDHVLVRCRRGEERLAVDEPHALAAAMARADREAREAPQTLVPEALLAGGASLGRSSADYGRAHGALPLDAVVRVAEDPRLDARARLAAVRTLASAPEPVRARVRVAIDEMADAELAEEMTAALGSSRSRTGRSR